LISIRHDPTAVYPESEDSFSPSERYPEYPFERLAVKPNRPYAMVRSLLQDAGLDRAHVGGAGWNPLRDLIPEGASVFVLCNFVYHRRLQDSTQALAAKCIHGSVLRAVIDYALLATGRKGRVTFGNAPLQSCSWNDVLSDTGAARVLDFYRDAGAPVSARDLRLYVIERDALGRVVKQVRRDQGAAGAVPDAAEIDLGDDSLLAELRGSNGGPRFRVSDYDPRRIEAFHANGSHRYVIHRAILDADVVISLSKLKTHEKVGITCGLKGFVGMVAHKDCLAHHRFGGVSLGGDEYPKDWSVLNAYSRFHDWVNIRNGDRSLQGAYDIADKTIRRVLRRLRIPTAGAWPGNDTCWRMALDLARIARYADRSGRMTLEPQRRHLTFIDGIIAGEGNGPLAPRPLSAGTLLFGDNVPQGDRVACRLMGFDPDALPLIVRAFSPSSVPLSPPGNDMSVLLNGVAVEERSLRPIAGRPFLTPIGWRGYFEAHT
jgi:hypothetical protein